MAVGVETAASDVILSAQESAASMAIEVGKNTVNTHVTTRSIKTTQNTPFTVIIISPVHYH